MNGDGDGEGDDSLEQGAEQLRAFPPEQGMFSIAQTDVSPIKEGLEKVIKKYSESDTALSG